MVTAAVQPVALAHMVGKGNACFGVYIAFKSVVPMVAAGASVPAAPASVRFKDVAVHGSK